MSTSWAHAEARSVCFFYSHLLVRLGAVIFTFKMTNDFHEPEFRRFFDRAFDGTQSFAEWMAMNRSAYRVMNRADADDRGAGFYFFMLDAYDGQLALE